MAKIKLRRPKILLWDIETSFNIAACWGIFEQTVHFDNILKERSILCASYKWLDERAIHSISIENIKSLDDKKLIEELHGVLSEADVICGHNGDKFDLPMFNARAIYHGLSPLPPIPTIDTLKVARKYFRFNSNRLDYLGKFLGCGRKIHNAPGLWLKILQGDEQALNKMILYNKQDVRLLEKVYLKLRGYMQNHPNMKILQASEIPVCPNCGSEHIQERGMRITRTRRYRRYQCIDCGAWSTGDIIK